MVARDQDYKGPIIEEVDDNEAQLVKRDAEEDSDAEEVEQLDSDAEEDKRDAETARNRRYVQWRRDFDQMKAQIKGKQSEASNLRAQGNNFFSFGCYQQATIMYTDAIDLDPDNAVLYCNRAMAYLKQSMPEEALADAELSLLVEPGVQNIKGHWRKSQALLDLGRAEEAEGAADEGILLEPANKHLNLVRKGARELICTRRLTSGEWAGKMGNGIDQRLLFKEDGTLKMTVMGHVLDATYELSVQGLPRSMLVKMVAEAHVAGTGPPPPPVPYIFEFKSDDELWICHPVAGSDVQPSEFKGPGFIKMARSTIIGPLEFADSIDVRIERYITDMIEVMPLIPPQLPEQPSDSQIAAEIEVTNRIAEIRRREGIDAHREAVKMAKHPDSAGTPELKRLARDLRRRLVTRRLIPVDEVEPVPEPAEEAAEQPKDEAESKPATKLKAGFLNDSKEPMYGEEGSRQGQIAAESVRMHAEQERGADGEGAKEVDPVMLDRLMEMKATAIDPKLGTPYLARTKEEATVALRQANGDIEVAAGLLMRGSASMVEPKEDEEPVEPRVPEAGEAGAPDPVDPDEDKEEHDEELDMVPCFEELKHPGINPGAIDDSGYGAHTSPEEQARGTNAGGSVVTVPKTAMVRGAACVEKDEDALREQLVAQHKAEAKAKQKVAAQQPGCLAGCIQSICGEKSNNSSYAP